MAAGRLLDPPIIVNVKNPKAATLTMLNNNQKFSRLKSGRKCDKRPFDFIDTDFNQNEIDQEPESVRTEARANPNDAQVCKTLFLF